MKIIARFQLNNENFAVVKLDGGKTFKSSYPIFTGDNAASLERVAQPARTVVQPGAFVQTPVARQTMENNVTVPLATCLIDAAFVGAASLCAWVYFGLPKPFAVAPGVTFLVAWYKWGGGRDFARDALMRIEDFTGVDLNGDGATGSQPVTRDVYTPMPIKTGPKKAKTTEQPRPAPVKAVTPGPDSLICIRPESGKRSARVVTLQDLWGFLQLSFERDDWTRDGWQARGVGPRLWKDYQTFLSGMNWWKITDRPTLDLALSRLGYTGTNERADERTNEVESD